MIQDFYRNKVMREAVKTYINKVITKAAVEYVFDRKDVSHIADAKELIDEAFSQMEVEYGIKKVKSNINEAR